VLIHATEHPTLGHYMMGELLRLVEKPKTSAFGFVTFYALFSLFLNFNLPLGLNCIPFALNFTHV